MDAQDVAHAAHTRVKLLANVAGSKHINDQWISHPLPAGTIVSITGHGPLNVRSSINPNPLSAGDFLYKLETELRENVPETKLQGPYTGYNDGQKIRHTALDTSRCAPAGALGMYQMGQKTFIRPGNEYTYRLGSKVVTLRGGDMISVSAKGTSKTGGPVLIANNAYYLTVYKVTHSLVQKQIQWRSEHYVSPAFFEVV